MRIHNQTPPPPRKTPVVAMAAGGLALGLPAALVGQQLADTYGSQVAHTLVDRGFRLVMEGRIPAQKFLAEYLPAIMNRQNQLMVGTALGATVGAAAGVYLAYELLQER